MTNDQGKPAVTNRCRQSAGISPVSQIRNAAQVLEAAALYFAIVFATGFALGLIRVAWAVPRFGERVAELIEQPLMLIAVVLAALWIVGHFRITMVKLNSIGIGLIALSFLFAAELAVVLVLRGLSITEYVEGRDPVSGTVYLFMLVVFALMPWLVRRRIGQLGASDIGRRACPKGIKLV